MRLIGAVAVVVLAAGGALAPAASASAAAPLEYSADGMTWSATPPASVFPAVRLAPGDVERVTIYLRSTRTITSVLTLALTDATASDPLFAAALALDARDEVGAGMAPTAFDGIVDCSAVIPAREVSAGQVVPVEFELTLAPTLTAAQAQNATAAFSLVVGLADPGAPVDAAGCPIGTVIPGIPGAGPVAGGPGSGGGIANTGSDVALRSAIVAGVLLALGAALRIVVVRRRSPASEEDGP